MEAVFDFDTHGKFDKETVLKDIEVLTDFIKYIKTTDRQHEDSKELADYRLIDHNLLQRRGIIYSEDEIDLMKLYPKLGKTSIRFTTNDTYRGRYLLPICLPDGRVFSFMSYTHDISQGFKYLVPKFNGKVLNWVKQGNILGNMESLSDPLLVFQPHTLFVTEGFFDAYRVNAELKAKSVALLGSHMTKSKKKILYSLKNTGLKLIYVPDMDKVGLEGSLIHLPIWDGVLSYVKYGNPKLKLETNEWLDIDDFFYLHRVNNLPLGTPIGEWFNGFSIK